MRKKNLSIILALVIAACNQHAHPTNNDKSHAIVANTNFNSTPAIIDSLELQSQFNKAKWLLYCLYCDDTCKFWNISNIKDTLPTLGTLSLKFDSLFSNADTLTLYFSFYYHDTLKLDNKVARFPYLTGVTITKGNDSVIALASLDIKTAYWNHSPQSRFANPLQPEVISYIRKNKNKIDPWFRNEAIKRGIFDTTANK